MDQFDAAAVLKRCWLKQSETFSSQQIILAMCPFCGKDDRINLLQPQCTNSTALDEGYQLAWNRLGSSERLPAFLRVLSERGHYKKRES